MSRKTKTTATKEQAKPALVPKLRFPEFRGAEGWENAILGDLSEVVRGGSPRPIDGFLTTAADGLNWLKIGDVDKEAKYVTHTAEKVRPEALSKTRVVNPGDLILSNSMSFGRPYILQIKTCIHDGWIAITDIAKNADRDFLYYSISAPSSQSYFVDNAAGSGVQNLNADIIKALPVCFPSRAEQQKIADCLSSVDELMAAQARKVDALKTHKRGLMQQLFPREGKTQPCLRFPEFQNAGEWEDDNLGAVCELYQPVTLSSSELSMTGEHLVYGANGVIGTHNEYNHEESEIAVTCRGATCGEVTITKPKSWITGNAMVVKPRTKKLQKAFIFQYFKNHGLKAVISGSAQPQITRTGFAPLVIFFPKPEEQQRIATCLNSLDALITAETQKLEALKTHKKGLMQQLYPSPEEMEA